MRTGQEVAWCLHFIGCGAKSSDKMTEDMVGMGRVNPNVKNTSCGGRRSVRETGDRETSGNQNQYAADGARSVRSLEAQAGTNLSERTECVFALSRWSRSP